MVRRTFDIAVVVRFQLYFDLVISDGHSKGLTISAVLELDGYSVAVGTRMLGFHFDFRPAGKSELIRRLGDTASQALLANFLRQLAAVPDRSGSDQGIGVVCAVDFGGDLIDCADDVAGLIRRQLHDDVRPRYRYLQGAAWNVLDQFDSDVVPVGPRLLGLDLELRAIA